MKAFKNHLFKLLFGGKQVPADEVAENIRKILEKKNPLITIDYDPDTMEIHIKYYNIKDVGAYDLLERGVLPILEKQIRIRSYILQKSKILTTN